MEEESVVGTTARWKTSFLSFSSPSFVFVSLARYATAINVRPFVPIFLGLVFLFFFFFNTVSLTFVEQISPRM